MAPARSFRDTGGMRRGGLSVLLAILSACAPDVEVRQAVVYDARHPETSRMDVFLPAGAPAGAARPAVLLVHGGGWKGGSRDHFREAARRLAQTGYVAATIDYRLVPEGRYPLDVQDCFCALAYLRAHAGELGLDPDRIVAMGYSAGGHLVSLLGLAAAVPAHHDCPDGPTGPPAAVIAGAGPQDLVAFAAWSDAADDVVVELLGGTRDQIPEVWAAASPSSYVRADAPPFLFIHAEGDAFVPLEQSERQRDRLVAAGADARLLSLSGGGHLFNEGVDPGHEYIQVSTDGPVSWAVIIGFLEDTVGVP
jgi:acetyl esterase/lipase